MKTSFPILALLGLGLSAAAWSAAAADQAAAMTLAKNSGCLACHSIDKKMVGPAWKDVARKYAGDAGAAEQLVLKVRKGTKGAWGPVPMPPNVTVKEENVRTLVDFVLGLK